MDRASVLAIVVMLALAGCAGRSDESADAGEERRDPTLLRSQFADVFPQTQGVPPECALSEPAEGHSAAFEIPAGATRARIEGTYDAAGRVGVTAFRDGSRVGFGAGGSPIVVELDAAQLQGASLAVAVAACDAADAPQKVRLTVMFRSG